jgi:hypothetical protein
MPATESDSLVGENRIVELGLEKSRAGPEKSRLKMGALSSKAKYCMRSIANEYREGKVKSIPMREMK